MGDLQYIPLTADSQAAPNRLQRRLKLNEGVLYVLKIASLNTFSNCFGVKLEVINSIGNFQYCSNQERNASCDFTDHALQADFGTVQELRVLFLFCLFLQLGTQATKQGHPKRLRNLWFLLKFDHIKYLPTTTVANI